MYHIKHQMNLVLALWSGLQEGKCVLKLKTIPDLVCGPVNGIYVEATVYEFPNQLGPCLLFIMRLKSTLSISAAGVLIYFNAANLKQSKIASSPFHKSSNNKLASLEVTQV